MLQDSLLILLQIKKILVVAGGYAGESLDSVELLNEQDSLWEHGKYNMTTGITLA